MVGLLGLRRLEEARYVLKVGVALVGRQVGGVERQRVEDPGLAIVGSARVELRHRALVGERARAMVQLVAVAIEGAVRLDVGALALGLRRRREAARDRLGAGLQRRRR